MFVPLEHASWPVEGTARDLRLSVNSPVLLGADASMATRAALGWQEEDGVPALRLWLRPERGPVQGFRWKTRLESPAARQTATEQAEVFLGGLGFLFDEGDPRPFEPAGAPIRGDLPLSKFRRRTAA